MQPHGELDDDPERPKRAGEELARSYPATFLITFRPPRERPVGERHGHAEHEVARRAVAVASRPRVGRCHYAAQRGATAVANGGPARASARGAEALLRGGERHAGLQHRSQVAHVVLDDPAEARRRQLHVHPLRGRPQPVFVAPPTVRTTAPSAAKEARRAAMSPPAGGDSRRNGI